MYVRERNSNFGIEDCFALNRTLKYCHIPQEKERTLRVKIIIVVDDGLLKSFQGLCPATKKKKEKVVIFSIFPKSYLKPMSVTLCNGKVFTKNMFLDCIIILI